MPTPVTVHLGTPVTHVPVAPGGEIVLKGSLLSRVDGSEIDAATTRWPEGAPGGASVDAGGLVDFDAGGLRMVARDPDAHVVKAVATGKSAPGCDAAGVAAPCLVLRMLPLARSRLLTMAEYQASLAGQLTLEIPTPPAYAPAAAAMATPWVQGTLALAGALALVGLGWTIRRRRARSPAGQLAAWAKRVRDKLARADAVLAAPLAPAVRSAFEALEARRLTPTSAEGERVIAALRRVEAALDASMASSREAEERAAADALVLEVEAALEAAADAERLIPGARAPR